MAEGFSVSVKEKEGNLSPLEEQCLREHEEEGDVEQDLLLEKEIAAQKLWQAFQESATAVAHLFRDCQQRAGLSAWVPFHESASAVTQLYRESADVCRQCVDSGIRYGHRRRNKDVLAWAKKKKRFIKREDLIAFLSDKQEGSVPQPAHGDLSSRMEDEQQHVMPPVPSPVGSCCYPGSLGSPRRRLFCREELPPGEGEVFGQRELSRKRQNNFSFDMTGINASLGANLGCSNSSELGPLMKRIKL